jgi:intracellular multiplication protein IcmK
MLQPIKFSHLTLYCLVIIFCQVFFSQAVYASVVDKKKFEALLNKLKSNQHETAKNNDSTPDTINSSNDFSSETLDDSTTNIAMPQQDMQQSVNLLDDNDALAEQAFNKLLQKNMPLTPNQVLRLRKQIDLAQRAAAVTANTPPKPVSTTLMINLAPGATAPAIRLSQGYVSSLVFIDSTGAPWPISGYQIGNPKATNIQWDGKSNILLLQAVTAYSDSNLVIRLANLDTPITLELISGQPVVDFRVDIHVSGLGPKAKENNSIETLPAEANQLLLNILDGISPEHAKMLTIKGGDCQGWLLDGKMYLRTRFTILSPGWLAKINSSDGMQAYEMPQSSSVLISRNGEPVELTIEDL